VRDRKQTAAAIKGILYAAGGQNGTLTPTLQSYNTATKKWATTTDAPMPTALNSFATAVYGGLDLRAVFKLRKTVRVG
jgi:hypothetical protein